MNKEINIILSNKKIKPTPMRELILDVFLQNSRALSLVDIEQTLSWSDKTTIYRTIKTFEKSGIIHKINDGSESVKYALCFDKCEEEKHIDIHPHFHCKKCGETICLNKQEINIKSIPEGFTVNSYSLIITGVCKACN